MVPIPKKLEVIIQKVYVGDRLVAETPEDEMFVFCTLPKERGRGNQTLFPLSDEEFGCVNMGALSSPLLSDRSQLFNMNVICGHEEFLRGYRSIQICGKAKDPADLARQLAIDVGSLMIEYGFFNESTRLEVVLTFSTEIKMATTINDFPNSELRSAVCLPLTPEETLEVLRNYESEIEKINQIYQESEETGEVATQQETEAEQCEEPQ
jgi:hypothetical protein